MTAKRKDKSKEQKKLKAEQGDAEEFRAQIQDLQSQKDEVFEKLQRLSADYANFQKRVPKQIADTIAYEKERIIKSLLPALDNFEHTLQNASSAENVDAVVKGVQIIYDQMLDILKTHGVEVIKALGEKFDPATHEAIMQKTDPAGQDSAVLEEFQKGYKLNGRVIRPTKVIVNKLPSEQQPQGDPHQEKPDLQKAE
ncbi:MAG: nucleotide exchange factor GrpE [Planctomycetota bacterium]|nr:MAG: nucleotide exchange factor GrpE [Planctomycetota bacterium]